jgi:hypothetical protein
MGPDRRKQPHSPLWQRCLHVFVVISLNNTRCLCPAISPHRSITKKQNPGDYEFCSLQKRLKKTLVPTLSARIIQGRECFAGQPQY